MTTVSLQPTLGNGLIKIQPLCRDDFERLYKVASDPLIWEQHPNKDRYKKEVFEIFFTGAIESGSAFLVIERATGNVIGSSRYYDLNPDDCSIAIGYTFLARACWGNGYNRALKILMLNYAFSFVDKVILHIGAGNIRSQKATEKLGAKKIGELEMQYYGEPPKLNFVYEIDKDAWYKISLAGGS